MLLKEDTKKVKTAINNNLERIRKFVPIRTGRLRSSLQVNVDEGGNVFIDFDVFRCPYAYYVKNMFIYIQNIRNYIRKILLDKLGEFKLLFIKIDVNNLDKFI